MNMSETEFHSSITTSPKITERFTSYLNLTTAEVERLRDFRLAMGWIHGFYGDSEPRHIHQEFRDMIRTDGNSPKAFADMYAVFYKSGEFHFGQPECKWYNQV